MQYAELSQFRRNYLTAIKEIVTPAEMEEAVFTDDKQTREENIRVITEKLEEAFADNEEWLAKLGEAVYQYQKKTVRKMILKDHKRPDGRAIDQIRPLAAEVDLIPRVHGSAMFTTWTDTDLYGYNAGTAFREHRDWTDWMRQRQQRDICIIIISRLTLLARQDLSRGPGRREIGHGALAERASAAGTSE